jgi:hypothetical protein
VARWRVLGGARPRTLHSVAEVGRAGFETAVAVAARSTYVAVQALDATGHVLGTSRVTRA